MCLQYLVAQIQESAADEALAVADDDHRAPHCLMPSVEFDADELPYASDHLID